MVRQKILTGFFFHSGLYFRLFFRLFLFCRCHRCCNLLLLFVHPITITAILLLLLLLGRRNGLFKSIYEVNFIEHFFLF